MTADDKCSLLYRDKLMQPIQNQLSKKQKKFFPIFFFFFFIFEILIKFWTNWKKMNLIAYVLTQLQTSRGVVKQMSKKPRFKKPYHKQNPKRSETLLKPARQHRCHIYWSMWKKITCKKSLLVIWIIFGLFLNTMTANEEHFLLNCDNITLPIQMQLSKKRKTSS